MLSRSLAGLPAGPWSTSTGLCAHVVLACCVTTALSLAWEHRPASHVSHADTGHGTSRCGGPAHFLSSLAPVGPPSPFSAPLLFRGSRTTCRVRVSIRLMAGTNRSWSFDMALLRLKAGRTVSAGERWVVACSETEGTAAQCPVAAETTECHGRPHNARTGTMHRSAERSTVAECRRCRVAGTRKALWCNRIISSLRSQSQACLSGLVMSVATT